MFSHVFTLHSKNSSKFLVLNATMLDKSPESNPVAQADVVHAGAALYGGTPV